MQDLYLLIIILIIPMIAQFKIMGTYKKYKNEESSSELSGMEVAKQILDKNGLSSIYVVETNGELSDHYDSSRKVIRLSKDIFHGTSIASISVAAHEVGHALQDKDKYGFFMLRSLIFPIVNLGTNFSYIILFIGIILSSLDLIMLGISLTALGLVFQLVTLPVEFDASKRAKKELEELGINSKEMDGVNKMLGAAAMTYVAGVIASALQILRLYLLYGDRD